MTRSEQEQIERDKRKTVALEKIAIQLEKINYSINDLQLKQY